MLGGSGLKEVETPPYLGSIVNNHGGTEADVKARIGKARVAFLQFKDIIKIIIMERQADSYPIFNSNVRSVLLYGSETWRTAKKTTRKVQTFIYNCLRRILKIHRPETISNVELLHRTKQGQMEIKRKVLGLDWAHTPKTDIQHHTTGP